MMHIAYNKKMLEQFLVFNDENRVNIADIFINTFNIKDKEVLEIIEVDDFNLDQFEIKLYNTQDGIKIELKEIEHIKYTENYISPTIQIENIESEIKGLQQALAEVTLMMMGGGNDGI